MDVLRRYCVSEINGMLGSHFSLRVRYGFRKSNFLKSGQWAYPVGVDMQQYCRIHSYDHFNSHGVTCMQFSSTLRNLEKPIFGPVRGSASQMTWHIDIRAYKGDAIMCKTKPTPGWKSMTSETLQETSLMSLHLSAKHENNNLENMHMLAFFCSKQCENP